MAIDSVVLNSVIYGNSGFGETTTENQKYSSDVLSIYANLINMNNNYSGEPERFLRMKYHEIILSEDIYQQDKKGMIKYQDCLADSRMKKVLDVFKEEYADLTGGSRIGFRYLADKNDVHHINRSIGKKTYYYYTRIVDFAIVEAKE
jgi:hypothetical protein